MEGRWRWERIAPLSSLLWLAVSFQVCTALNCALPQPQLVGVLNATAVQLPVDIVLTTTYRQDAESDDLLFVATQNLREIPWNEKITIKTPGRHRILTAVAELSTECSRTDLFVFDGFLAAEPSITIEDDSRSLECLPPEIHLIILWSAMPEDQFSKFVRIVSAFSDVVDYPEANYHLRLLATLRVDPGEDRRFDEGWYQEFYGDTYYGLFFGTSEKVDMVHVKGDGAFRVLIVEDLCPKYAFHLKRNMMLNTNTFATKNILRRQSPHWYQVHTTLTLQESDTDYHRLFGTSGRAMLQALQLDKLSRVGGHARGLRVPEAVYILSWRRIFLPVDAMEVLGVIMQSEWYRFELDVPALHAELSAVMLNPDVTSSQENIHRAAFLGSSRLPLLAHLPADTRWYRGMLELRHVKRFRVLKDSSWGQQLPPCSAVGVAATAYSAQDLYELKEGNLRDHVGELQHRTDHFNHTIVVVGANVDGPFTIWDGNHRAIALALTHSDSHLLLVYVGISPRFASPHTGSLFCP